MYRYVEQQLLWMKQGKSKEGADTCTLTALKNQNVNIKCAKVRLVNGVCTPAVATLLLDHCPCLLQPPTTVLKLSQPLSPTLS